MVKKKEAEGPLGSLSEEIQKRFKNAFHRADSEVWHTDFLRTSVGPVDWILGGGFGYGRISELFGPYSSGKTMLLYRALANNQRMRGRRGEEGQSFLFEAEGSFSKSFFASQGGDPNRLLIYPATTCEEVFDAIDDLCDLMAKLRNKGDDTPIAVGWDSLAATSTKHLQETGMEKRDMSKSFVTDQGFKLIGTKIKSCRMALIVTNQTREKIGDTDSATHTPGGNALKFWASHRVELDFKGGTKTSSLYSKSDLTQEIGKMLRVKVVKNKLASPFGHCNLNIYTKVGPHPEFDRETCIGIDDEEALFDFYCSKQLLLGNGEPVIHLNGGWYKFNPELRYMDKNFRFSDWPDMLMQYPNLHLLLYQKLEQKLEETKDVESGGSVPDNSEVQGIEATAGV